MAPPVTKLDIPSVVARDAIPIIEAFLVAHGFPEGTDDTHHLACACGHLGQLYPVAASMSVHIEFNPSHYLITVDQL
jgi:hypothetical protein